MPSHFQRRASQTEVWKTHDMKGVTFADRSASRDRRRRTNASYLANHVRCLRVENL